MAEKVAGDPTGHKFRKSKGGWPTPELEEKYLPYCSECGFKLGDHPLGSEEDSLI